MPPFIVFDDVDLDKAVKGAMAAKFATSGQDCLAANRIYVQRGVYGAFVEKFATAIARLRVGHGLDAATDVGPMTKSSVAEKPVVRGAASWFQEGALEASYGLWL